MGYGATFAGCLSVHIYERLAMLTSGKVRQPVLLTYLTREIAK